MRKKIAFIGAGSFGFTRNLVRDILSYEAFQDVEIALMDIDKVNLGFIEKAVKRIIEAGNYRAKLTVTMDREVALKDADGVVITILHGGPIGFAPEIEIPEKYHVDVNVGDTRGPSGIFRFLRTLPPMIEICESVRRCCPNAIVLNYTNPMAMLCRALQGLFPELNITGLCHSVQGTAMMLADWIGAKYDDISYVCAGINHQAFYLEYKWKGKDAYPLIHKAITQRKEIYEAELVRNEMYLALNYYVTESSGHNSEYTPWFRKRPDLIEKYCTHGTNWNPGLHAFSLNLRRDRLLNWKKLTREELKKPVDLKRGLEYASRIFNALFGDHEVFKFNGNLRNFGLINNLPEGCCVEVPVYAGKDGIQAMHVGDLPAQLAVLVNLTSRCEELAVEGALAGDPNLIYHACIFDPLTSAVLSLDEIRSMVNELFAADRKYLGYFKSTKVKI
ncbi:MAG: hypothetical protein IJS15_02990 [Victivallales bacterium]|nr:hypothetical protein [Victivallales bacterium]